VGVEAVLKRLEDLAFPRLITRYMEAFPERFGR